MSDPRGPNYMSRVDRAVRRDKVVELYLEGNPPSVIAELFGMTTNHIRQIVFNAGARAEPSPDARQSNSMWDMNEDDRRKAIISRAARGARETLIVLQERNLWNSGKQITFRSRHKALAGVES